VTDSAATETFDALVADLQSLRIRAGGVTYDELAAQITRDRESRGIAPAAARVARSTVYDSFRSGRRRINPELVAEIVVALGGDDEAANEWRQRCQRARLGQTPRASTLAAEDHLPSGRALVAIVMLASLGLNLFGNATSARTGTPLFLDMIGTAIVSITFGPWYGVAVGVSTNLLASLSNSPQALPFALVNIVGALVWGYGVRSWGLGRTPLRFFSLNLIVAAVCTLTAAPIIALGFRGLTVDDASATAFATMQGYGASLWEAVLASNLTVSVADKLIAGAIALAVALVLLRQPAVSASVLRPPVLWRPTARRRTAPVPKR